ncbi:MAG: TonB-dependent receptor [Pseudomonadota bacterium]
MAGGDYRMAMIGVAAAGVGASEAAGQEGEPIILRDIVIEGELIDRTVQDTRTSVAVIQGEELERASDFDLYDVVERTPGVFSAFGEKGFAIRGVDQRGVGGAGNGLLVSTTVDGATVSNSNVLTFFGPYSNWDLEQIEILRGPQSTQTGRNALAGAIVIRSKDPTYDFEAKARGEVASRETFGGSAAVNIPYEDAALAFRFSADARRTDGFVDNPTRDTDEYDAREQETYRAAVRFDPTDELSAILKYSHSRNFGGEDFVEAALFPGRRVNFSDADAEEGAVIDSVNLRVSYAATGYLTLESETTYFDADYTRTEDFDFSAEPIGTIFRDSDVENLQQEAKVLLDLDRVTGVLGAFYTDISDVAPSGGTIPASFVEPDFAELAPGATILLDNSRDTQTENFAFFGEVEFRPIPKLGLIFGARYDRETIELTSVNAFSSENEAVQGFLPPTTVEESSTTFDAFLPKFGVVYDATDDLSFGFVAQRGYRSGGTSVNLLTGERSDFGPEKTWNFEASVRSQWFGDRLTVNANVFYTDWTDQQVEVLGPSGNPLDTNTVNAGKSELFGGEVEMRAQPIDGLDVFASGAFVETRFRDFPFGEENFAGNDFPFAPRFTAAFGATYSFENGFYVGGAASFTDDAFGNVENDAALKTDSRFLVNAQVGFRADRWEVFAFARNLFDVDYVTGAAVDETGELQRVRTGEPLTVGVAGRFVF